MCKVCDTILVCSNIKCILVNGCKDLTYCVNKVVGGVYEGMMCMCSDGSYETPMCVTDSPSMSPSMSPTNVSIWGMNVGDSVNEGIEDYILYFILGGVFIILCVLIYFRKKVKEYVKYCGGSCNRVNDGNES